MEFGHSVNTIATKDVLEKSFVAKGVRPVLFHTITRTSQSQHVIRQSSVLNKRIYKLAILYFRRISSHVSQCHHFHNLLHLPLYLFWICNLHAWSSLYFDIFAMKSSHWHGVAWNRTLRPHPIKLYVLHIFWGHARRGCKCRFVCLFAKLLSCQVKWIR